MNLKIFILTNITLRGIAKCQVCMDNVRARVTTILVQESPWTWLYGVVLSPPLWGPCEGFRSAVGIESSQLGGAHTCAICTSMYCLALFCSDLTLINHTCHVSKERRFFRRFTPRFAHCQRSRYVAMCTSLFDAELRGSHVQTILCYTKSNVDWWDLKPQ